MAGRVSVVDEGKRVQHGEIIVVYPGQRSSLSFLQIGGVGEEVQYTPLAWNVSVVSLSKCVMIIEYRKKGGAVLYSDFVIILRLASLQYIAKLAMSKSQKLRSPLPQLYSNVP
jgi:hypothetical protein